MVFGMSLALYGGITMKNGAIEQENFRDGGRIVRMGEMPRRTWVDLVESDALLAAWANLASHPSRRPSRMRSSHFRENGFANCL